MLQELLRLPAQPSSVPATSAQGRDYLVKCVPAHNAGASHAGWVVSIVDVTDIHEAQRQRDQAIGFLSDDMRAPQSAILSLLELRRTHPERLPLDQFEERVERHAREDGMSVILWSVDTNDWEQRDSAVVARRAIKGLRRGSIILMHDGGGERSQTVEQLAGLIDRLAAAGYAFVLP